MSLHNIVDEKKKSDILFRVISWEDELALTAPPTDEEVAVKQAEWEKLAPQRYESEFGRRKEELILEEENEIKSLGVKKEKEYSSLQNKSEELQNEVDLSEKELSKASIFSFKKKKVLKEKIEKASNELANTKEKLSKLDFKYETKLSKLKESYKKELDELPENIVIPLSPTKEVLIQKHLRENWNMILEKKQQGYDSYDVRKLALAELDCCVLIILAETQCWLRDGEIFDIFQYIWEEQADYRALYFLEKEYGKERPEKFLINALIRNFVDKGLLVKAIEDGKAYFRIKNTEIKQKEN